MKLWLATRTWQYEIDLMVLGVFSTRELAMAAVEKAPYRYGFANRSWDGDRFVDPKYDDEWGYVEEIEVDQVLL